MVEASRESMALHVTELSDAVSDSRADVTTLKVSLAAVMADADCTKAVLADREACAVQLQKQLDECLTKIQVRSGGTIAVWRRCQ